MRFKNIKVSDLIVNPSNDRHGPTGSETAAISWLFQNKPKEMRKLASRIAKAGRVFDSPLVVEENGKYLVRDGNRRVTCIRLIHQPDSAPLGQRDFFKSLHDDVSDKLSKSISCQIETDLDQVEQIIETRHNGVQEGEGQLPWGTREKAIHANRVSGKSDYAWSQRIEDYLIANGYRDEAITIKRSTLDRLLSAKKHRERLGLSDDAEGKLTTSQSPQKTTELLLTLVEDMQEKRLTLNELLKASNKIAYIDVLASKGLLPESKKQTHSKIKATTQKTASTSTPPSSKATAPTTRATLIPRHVNYDFAWSVGQNKIHLAWEQLQYQLDLEKNKFAVAVVLRTLIDLTTQNFLNKNKMQSRSKLVKDLRCVNQTLLERGLLDKSQHRDALRIIEGGTSSDSIESLQRVLHSESHLPTKDELTTLWDCLEPLLVASLKFCQKVGQTQR